jgi:hypothetical protein
VDRVIRRCWSTHDKRPTVCTWGDDVEQRGNEGKAAKQSRSRNGNSISHRSRQSKVNIWHNLQSQCHPGTTGPANDCPRRRMTFRQIIWNAIPPMPSALRGCLTGLVPGRGYAEARPAPVSGWLSQALDSCRHCRTDARLRGIEEGNRFWLKRDEVYRRKTHPTHDESIYLFGCLVSFCPFYS